MYEQISCRSGRRIFVAPSGDDYYTEVLAEKETEILEIHRDVARDGYRAGKVDEAAVDEAEDETPEDDTAVDEVEDDASEDEAPADENEEATDDSEAEQDKED